MEQKKKETLGIVMAVCGGICWGFPAAADSFYLRQGEPKRHGWWRCACFLQGLL